MYDTTADMAPRHEQPQHSERRPPEIPPLTGELDERLTRMHDRLQLLRHRLEEGGVLAPPDPRPGGLETLASPARSPRGEQIRSFVERVDQAHDDIESILARLEV